MKPLNKHLPKGSLRPERPVMVKPLSDGYTAWLIERQMEGSFRGWLTLGPKFPWAIDLTTNADSAIHFSRQHDAQRMVDLLGLVKEWSPCKVLVTEHMWSD